MDNEKIWKSERFWLFTIAALCLVLLGVVVYVLGFTEKQPNEMLFGSLITGLLMIVQKVIEAQSLRQAVQKLGESQPMATPNEDTPAGTEEDPLHVAGAGAGETPVLTKASGGKK